MEQQIYKIKLQDIKEGPPKEKKIGWQMEETPNAPRSKELLIGFLIVTLGFLVFGLLTKNYFFVLIILLAVFIMYLQSRRDGEMNDFELSDKGVSVNEKLYSYDDFESFWIFGTEHEHGCELALRNKRKISPLFLIPLLSKDLENIEETLSKHLPKREEKESLIDLLRKAYF